MNESKHAFLIFSQPNYAIFFYLLMSYLTRKILAIVPARGGSKSIPRKNLAMIRGKTLIRYVSEICNALSFIDFSILSTDDEEIAKEGRLCGLEVPFIRPSELAEDHSSSVSMMRHAWLSSEEHFSCTFDVGLLLEPTSPLRKTVDIIEALEKLFQGNYSSICTVSKTPGHYTPHKTLEILPDDRISFFHPHGQDHSIRQTIPPYYHRNGICYAVKRETLIDQNSIITNNTGALIINRDVVNIDDPLDLRIADLLLTIQ